MEYIALISTASMLVITGVIYSVNSRKDREKDLPDLIRTYNSAELATRKLRKELGEYIKKHYCQNDHFKHGLTFGEASLFLKKAGNTLFTKAHRRALMDISTSDLELDRLMEEVSAHHEKVDAFHAHLKRYFLKEYPVGVPQ